MIKQKTTQDDYPLIQLIWERSVQATHDFLKPDDFNEIKAVLPTYFPHVDLNLWLIDGEVIGFSGTHGSSLEMLFLDPSSRGKGYGKEIISELISEGIDKVDVNEQNESAKAFYFSCGFRVASRSEKDSDGRDYPILHLVLTNLTK